MMKNAYDLFVLYLFIGSLWFSGDLHQAQVYLDEELLQAVFTLIVYKISMVFR
jgi:hypothetical protein